jgi:uncharacterized protein YidB (DUF937 family)
MGLLDGLLGGLMGDNSATGSRGGSAAVPIAMIALQVLQQNGGIQGVLAKCQQAGFGDHAQSWIGTGQNMPIDPSSLSQIFGGGQLGQIAQQLGLSHDQASSQLAQALPKVIDTMTPEGTIPANHSDLVNQALAILQQRGRA